MSDATLLGYPRWMLLLLGVLACAPHPSPPASPEPTMAASDDVAGVTDPTLRALLHDHWEAGLARSPLGASRLGDHRYDDRLDDISAAALAAARIERDGFATRAAAIDPSSLGPDDRTTLELFRADLETSAGTDVCHVEQWGLSIRTNPVVTLGELGELQSIDTPKMARDYVARLRAFPTWIASDHDNLRAGIAAGRTPERVSVGLVVEQIDRELARPVAEWAAAGPAMAEHPTWSADERDSFRRDVLATLEGDTLPALRAYRAFLDAEVRPAARPEDRAGVWALPDGEACYRALIRQETTLSLDAATIHQTGLDELARIHAEMQDLGERLFGTRDLAAIFTRLREDPALRFRTSDEVEQKAASALAAAKARIPAYFGRLPQADCGVRRVPDVEAPYTTIAYYRPVVPGEQPGYYYINVYAPETRPRFEAEVLAFHESIPGHHLQIAIAQELPELPAFRRYALTNAYVEGWALYVERLADEMGLYSSDLDRMGMLSFDTWRASRLVVDTGIHAMGWDRARAEKFMLENTPLAANNIHNEVDRYATWPAQALAYKLGQLEIRSLRAEAEQKLGSRFSLPAFHDAILGGGAVTLPVLRSRMEEWMAREAGPGLQATGP